MMHFSNTTEIYKLVESFENRIISKADWTHTARLAVGLFYIKRMPFAVAKNLMRDGIVWLNDVHGTPNTDVSGYHETLTVFWLKRIWNFVDTRSDCNDLASLANDLIQTYNDPHFPFEFYSRGLLLSAKARRDYYPHDLHVQPAYNFAITLATLKPLL